MLPIVFLLATLLASGLALTPRQKSEIDRLVQDIMGCHGIPAVSLSLVSMDNQEVYSKAYGSADRSSGQQATAQDAFCIGGASKAFTAVLLAKLIDINENVTWDTPVQDILGVQVALKEAYVGDHLTLKDIFAMRSGISAMDIVPWAHPYDIDSLIRNLRYAPLSAGFREKYVHSDILFAVVLKVAEKLGSDTWYNLMQRHIFQPLQMTQTTFIGTKHKIGGNDAVKANVYYQSQLNSLKEETFNGLDLIAPAASICTSADDMSKWLTFLLYGGRSMSNTLVVREDDLNMLFHPITSRGQGDPSVIGFSEPEPAVGYSLDQNALGFITGYYRGSPFVAQEGALPGYQTLATIIPSKNVAAYVSFSSDEKPVNFAAKVLFNQLGLDYLMDDQTWFRTRTVCDIMDQMGAQFSASSTSSRNIVRINQKGPRNLEEYEGNYKNYGFGDLMVKLDNTSDQNKFLIMKYGQIEYAMEPTNVNDTFQLIARDGIMWYTTGADYYRTINKIFAAFSFHPRDEEERITKVTVTGFSDEDVEFSVNPREPEFDIGRIQDAPCGAQGLIAPFSTSVAASLLILFTLHLFGR